MGELSMVLAVPVEVNPNKTTLRVAGTKECPRWVLADIAKVLDVGNVSDMARRLDEDEKGIDIIDTPGGSQEMLTVNEAGFYKVTLSSRADNAKAFQRWVCHEVLPAIRRFGCYPPPAPGSTVPGEITLAAVRDLVRAELRSAFPVTPASPVVTVLHERRPDYVEPRSYILRCWPGCSPRVQRLIVRMMATIYQRQFDRLAPQETPAENSPLVIERENLFCLTRAIAFYWRKEHQTGPGTLFEDRDD